MRVALFGATGRLGRDMAFALATLPGIELLCPPRGEVDLLLATVMVHWLKEKKPDLIINCAAFNGLEQCQSKPTIAFAVNTLGTVAMAEAAKALGAVFIQFSTDYAETPSGPNDSAPWYEYGLSKQVGERAAMTVNPYTVIFRLTSIYSSTDFAGSLDAIKQFKAGKGKPEDPIRVLRQCTTPTSTYQIASVMAKAVPQIMRTPRSFSGIYPLTTQSPIWKADFARHALKLFLDVDDARIVEGILPIPRPLISVMPPCPLIGEEGEQLFQMPTVMDDLKNEASRYKERQ